MICLTNAYSWVRPLLFRLEPELAHSLTLMLLKYAPRGSFGKSQSREAVELAGLKFSNRIGLAAGLDKNAKAIEGLANLGFGFIEIGAVTPQPQSGNPKPRVFRLEQHHAIINRMGFNNDGVEQIAQRISRSRQTLNIPIGVNIGKNKTTPNEHALADYLHCCETLYEVADYLSINVSSPNTPGLRDLQKDTAINKLLIGITQRCEELAQSKGTRTPIFVKISPDMSTEEIVSLVESIQRTGCDGIIATNTTLSRKNIEGKFRSEAGGLSGTPLHHLACQTIQTVRNVSGVDFPIIGVGGILDSSSMNRMLDAGADVVQVYTGLIYRGPSLINELSLL